MQQSLLTVYFVRSLTIVLGNWLDRYVQTAVVRQTWVWNDVREQYRLGQMA